MTKLETKILHALEKAGIITKKEGTICALDPPRQRAQAIASDIIGDRAPIPDIGESGDNYARRAVLMTHRRTAMYGMDDETAAIVGELEDKIDELGKEIDGLNEYAAELEAENQALRTMRASISIDTALIRNACARMRAALEGETDATIRDRPSNP